MTTNIDSTLDELSLMQSELGSLDLLGSALTAGANPKILFKDTTLHSGVSALLGEDPLVLSTEDLKEAVEDKTTEAKKVFWTKRKKMVLAGLTTAAAAITASILLAKRKGPEVVQEFQYSTTGPIIDAGPATTTRPEHFGPGPASKVPGRGLAPITGQGVVDRTPKRVVPPPTIGSPGRAKPDSDRDAVGVAQKFSAANEKLYALRKRAIRLDKLGYADIFEKNNSRVDLGKLEQDYDNVKDLEKIDLHKLPLKTAQARQLTYLNSISDRIDEILARSSNVEDHIGYERLSPEEAKAYADRQNYFVREANDIASKVKSTIESLYK